MKKLIVLVGLPGSGKSTEARKHHNGDWFYYSTDNYIEDVAKIKGMTYSDIFSSTIKKATNVMNDGVKEAFENGHSILWDQTNMTKKKRKGILDRTPKGYEKICFCFIPPRNKYEDEELHRRLVNRPGKEIPEHVMKNMKDQYEKPTLDEGFDKVYFFNIYGELEEQRIDG